MINLVYRLAKRFAILLPALFVAYLSIFNIFPVLDNRLPLLVAAFLTYILAAYILIPALLRVFRIIVPPRHVPLYCVTRDGFASDPLNIALIGTREQVAQAMQAIGWKQADSLSFKNISRLILSTIYKWEYPKAPMSRLYLFGRKQDMAFQLPTDKPGAQQRHHVRFWATTYNEGDTLNVQTINWQQREEHVQDDTLLWLGAASLDIGVTFIRHNIQFTHLVDSDTDSERDLLTEQLVTTGSGSLHKTIKLSEPYKLVNIHALRGNLHTDARLKIIQLADAATVRTTATNQDSSAR